MHAARYNNVTVDVWHARGVIATIVGLLASLILGMLLWLESRLEDIRIDLHRDVQRIDNYHEQRMNDINSTLTESLRQMHGTIERAAAQAHTHTNGRPSL